MPKLLSLKKNNKEASNNQRAITHFFKNSDINGTQLQTSIKKKELPKTTASDLKPTKRKAVSPPKLDFNYETTSFPNNTQNSKSPLKLAPKKHKLENTHSKVAQKNNTAKYNDSNNVLMKKAQNILEDVEKFNNKYKNTPLPCVNTDIISTCDNYKNSNYDIKENENRENILEVKSLKMTLEFDHSISKPINKNVIISPKKYCSVSVVDCEEASNLKTYKSPEISPSKSGTTIKLKELCENDVNDLFGYEWDIDNVPEELSDNLDLTTMQRCEVTSVKLIKTTLELGLRSDNLSTTCLVEGSWLCLNIQGGDIVSILATRDSSGRFHVNSTSGLIVFRPDYLLSSTSVVAGVFCQRKAVLQERWRGIDSANIAMTVGILIHELVQKALTERILSTELLRSETDKIIKESTQMLFDAGLGEDEARSNMEMYIIPLSEFMNKYVADKPIQNMQTAQNNWPGRIENVLDIEENLCCPKLGLKGKIDATLEVTIHERQGKQRSIVPLEIKSGRASGSVEHRGQLVLYGMMLSVLRAEDPTTALQRGLLLYLKERVEIREVSCGYPERRDLVILRNQLVQYLTTKSGRMGTRYRPIIQLYELTAAFIRPCLALLLPEWAGSSGEVPRLVSRSVKTKWKLVLYFGVSSDDDSDIAEDKFQRLPEPVHRETACAKCPYLTVCSLHLWHTEGPVVSKSHPLSKLREEALGHLSPQHIEYFLHWTRLLKLEEKVQSASAPLHALWTDSVEKRVKRGTCTGNLRLQSVQSSGHRYLHVFQRDRNPLGEPAARGSKSSGPQEGDFSIVSIHNRPWLAAGVVVMASHGEIKILLERDLSLRQSGDTAFQIDAYESYASTVQNLTNLGVLIEDSERAKRLRSIIIDRARPSFVEKLPREMHRLGAKLMRKLNIEQQRAVFKAISAKDYALLQGLPGTGKTQTVSVLIQMLVALKQRVLVTAHTHSAVDTVLCRLPESIKIMRLGTSTRVAPSLLNICEERLTSTCHSSEQLSQLYESMEVVGVTCLGAAHAMLARTSFDVCIVDEATQVLQCTVLRPLFAAKRFILVGDPEQLPPVVRRHAARQLGMEESLFHRLMTEAATTTLQLQYRMNQALADLANRIAYSDRLKCANPSVANACLNIDVAKISPLYSSESPWLLTACSTEPEYAAVFINLESVTSEAESNIRSKTISNWEEACIVLALVEAMKEGGVKNSDIGVIAPYRDQVALLRRTLAHLQVEASTVDQFQGRDKSAIIYSCTKRDDGQKNKMVKEEEILNDQRRLAVSVTRSKHKLIVIGNSHTLRRYEPIRRLIDACHQVSIDIVAIKSLLIKYKNLQCN